MKKVKFIILSVFLMATAISCSKYEDYESNDKPVEASEEGLPEIKSFSGKNSFALGYGYDITKGFVNYTAVRTRVVDMERFLGENPLLFHSNVGTSGMPVVHAGATALDFAKEVNKKHTAGVSVFVPKDTGLSTVQASSGGAASLGDSFDSSKQNISANIKFTSDINKKNSFSTRHSYARGECIKEHKKVYVDANPEELMDYLTNRFKQDVNTLTPTALVGKYGTHVLLHQTVGGKITFDYRSEVYEVTSKKDKKTAVDIGVTAIMKNLGISANYGYDQNTVTTMINKNHNWILVVEYFGGSTSGVSYSQNTKEGIQNITIDEDAWKASIEDKNSIIIDIDWDKAYPIYDFITDPLKKSQVKAAVDKYIKDNQEKIEIIEVAPLFRIHASSTTNTSFTTSTAEFDHMKSKWKYNPDNMKAGYLQGYVFTEEQPGTVPLYRLHSQKQNNTSFTTSADERKHMMAKWDFKPDNMITSEIQGYVYKDQHEGTAPLYRLHSWWASNTSFTTDDDERRYMKSNWDFKDDKMITSHIQGYVLK